MESMLPALTAKKRFGGPKVFQGSQVCQSGCGKTATVKPADSRARVRIPAANEGWST